MIGNDLMDSRDIDERITELEEEIAEYKEDGREPDYYEEEQEELNMLLEFRDEYGDGEWDYGVTFIHEHYFTGYAEQMAYDIGAVDEDADWPTSYIDWEAAAEALKMDYQEAELDGNTYYYR